MSFKAIHLHLLTYPAPTPRRIVAYACVLAGQFEARLSVSIAHPIINVPSHWLAGPMLASAARSLEAEAIGAANALEQLTVEECAMRKLALEIKKVPVQFPAVYTEEYWLGRTSDLGIFPLPRQEPEQMLSIERWLFQTGHPALLYPEDAAASPSFDTILVSWDFSQAASRTITGALPLLKRAKNIRVTTVRGEKDIPVTDTMRPLLDYLAAHGVAARADEIGTGGRPIGEVLLQRADEIGADLIVMGAFGHSRLQEFLLGGATKSVLAGTPRPVFMSH